MHNIIILIAGLICILSGVLLMVYAHQNSQFFNSLNKVSGSAQDKLALTQDYNNKCNDMSIIGIVICCVGVVLLLQSIYCLFFENKVKSSIFIGVSVVIMVALIGVLVLVVKLRPKPKPVSNYGLVGMKTPPCCSTCKVICNDNKECLHYCERECVNDC